MNQKVSAVLLFVINVLLALVMIGMAVLVVNLGKEVRSYPEILEIRENGDSQWYNKPIKLYNDYVPTDLVYEQVIKDFIRGLRMVDGFWDNNKELVLRALYCTTGDAKKMFQRSVTEKNPFEKQATVRIDVPKNSINVTKVSQELWKASWRERTYDTRGEKIMEEEYEAVFHVKLREALDTHTKEMNPKCYNPLGIYIYDYDIDLLHKLM